jgi:hypothetical protein
MGQQLMQVAKSILPPFQGWPEVIGVEATGRPFPSRSRGQQPNIDSLLNESKAWQDFLRVRNEPVRAGSLRHLKLIFARPLHIYYALAAASRKSSIEDVERQRILSILFSFRSALESEILNAFDVLEDQKELEKAAFNHSFFGVSAKQGVSIRFPLSSCVPTRMCGGRCYAHDGRDRELHLVFRAAMNFWVAQQFELYPDRREFIGNRLLKAIEYGANQAVLDAASARAKGYSRAARIRFSHIGEMAALPSFSNWLARQIKEQDPSINCVVYSRHPDIGRLDTSLFIINFTLEGSDDARHEFAPANARLVSSSWDGETSDKVEVNFLEHHVEKKTKTADGANFCPVTLKNLNLKSCDEARCERCFIEPNNWLAEQV